MKPTSTDYSLYLVTDSTPATLGNSGLIEVVEAGTKSVSDTAPSRWCTE